MDYWRKADSAKLNKKDETIVVFCRCFNMAILRLLHTLLIRGAAALGLFAFSTSLSAADWLPDSLGRGFEKSYVAQPDDYAGSVRCTVVRYDARGAAAKSRKGILYIHGFNDYFFQKEMAQQFVSHGYRFYAVDLRRYGRSLMPGQKPFLVRKISEYFADIDSALRIMTDAGIDSIAIMGHSTEGLVASCYMEHNPPTAVRALILNSPFLEWNLVLPARILVPAIAGLGRIFPSLTIPQSGSVYGESLDARWHGEWSYNRAWKLHDSSDVDAGWIRAIERAQFSLKRHPYAIKVPILLMYSARSYKGDKWTPEAQRADAVLDVADIRRVGMRLGHKVTPLEVEGGMHDLILSSPDVRYPLYDRIFAWLSENL